MAWIPVSIGELIDRLTILELKLQHLGGVALIHVQQQHARLSEVYGALGIAVNPQLRETLAAVNGQLWEVEDAIRGHERRGSFDAAFIALARQVYQLNDQRHALKRAIDQASGSPLIEEKHFS